MVDHCLFYAIGIVLIFRILIDRIYFVFVLCKDRVGEIGQLLQRHVFEHWGKNLHKYRR